MYEVMSAWEQPQLLESDDPVVQDDARVWAAADKVVYSRTLDTVSTARTRLEHDFDPTAVRALVDACHLFLGPVVDGGGTRALPDGVRADLELADEQRFGNGVVHLSYPLPRRS